MTASPLYRPCVGIVLFNQSGKVFVGERIDTPGAWQMPQGGIDPGEDLITAALRELTEETGITPDKATLIRVHETPIRYDLPPEKQKQFWDGQYVGQEQQWLAFRFTGTDADINLSHFDEPEFSRWQWVDLHDTLDMIVPFKQDAYQKIIDAFKDIK